MNLKNQQQICKPIVSDTIVVSSSRRTSKFGGIFASAELLEAKIVTNNN